MMNFLKNHGALWSPLILSLLVLAVFLPSGEVQFLVAFDVAQGLSYREIAAMGHCSTATITRINEWLQHGRGGYRMMLERLGLDEEGR